MGEDRGWGGEPHFEGCVSGTEATPGWQIVLVLFPPSLCMTELAVRYLLCNFYMDNLLSGAHRERQSCETDSSALLRGYIIQLTSEYRRRWEPLWKRLSSGNREEYFFFLPRTEKNQAENKCKKIRKEYKSTLVSTEHLSLAPGALLSQRQWSCKRIPPGEGGKKSIIQSKTAIPNYILKPGIVII